MTSHLSVTTSANDTGAVTTGFSNAAKSGKTDSPLGAFDAILDALGAAATGAASGGLLGALTKLAGNISAETPPAAGLATPLANTTAAAATSAAVMASLTSTDASVLTPPVTDGLAVPPVTTDAVVPVPLAPDPTVTVPLAADATDAPPVTTDTTGTETEPANPTPPVQPKLLSHLVTALNALDKAQRSGEPVDDDMLKRVKQAVDTMSGFLAALQPALAETTTIPAATTGDDALTAIAPADGTPTQIPVVPPITDPAPSDTGTPAATPTASVDSSGSASAPRIPLAPLARKIEDVVAGLGTTAPELSAKLTALVQSLGSGQLSADTLNALGVGSSNNPPDPKLAVAITTFVASPQSDSGAVQPQLAAPNLKLPPDSVLKVGAPDGKTKSDDGGTAAAPTITKPSALPAAAAGDAGNGNASRNDKGDQKPAIAPAVATGVAQGTADKTQDPSTGTNPAVPGATPVTPITQPAAAQAAAAAYQTAAPQVNLPQLAFEIVRHAQQGSNQFQIRLDPADMGRIDVNLDIASSGTVNAHLTVEHPETLDLLKRDSGALGAALSQAGLDSSKTNLEFSLRQNPFGNQNNNGGGYSPAPGDNSTAAEDPVIPVSASTLYRGSLTSSGLNIFV